MLKSIEYSIIKGIGSRDFFVLHSQNDLPEDVDGDAEEDDEDEADDDESEHPVAQDSSICQKKIRFIKGTIRERLPFRVIVARAF